MATPRPRRCLLVASSLDVNDSKQHAHIDWRRVKEVEVGELDAARKDRDRAEAWFAGHPLPDERFARRRAELARLLGAPAPR